MQAHPYRIASISIYSDSTMLFTKAESVAFVMTSSISLCLCDKKKLGFYHVLIDSAGGQQLKLTLFAKIRVAEKELECLSLHG